MKKHRFRHKKISRFWTILAMVLLPILVQSQSLTMNFRNVEIKDIIESVGELTGRSFLVDPRVRGKVTIIANDTVSEDEVYDLFLTILRMHGFRAIEGEHLTRIVPANVGPRYSAEKISDELVTEIIPIKYLASGSVIPILKPMMTPQAQVLNHKDTNYLIITEVGSNLAKVKQILSSIDVPAIEDYEIIDLKYVDAVSMHKVLQKAGNKGLRHMVNIIADEDANRLILTGRMDIRMRIRALIAELDTPASVATSSGSIRIIPLRYAKAEELAKIIKNLFSSSEFLKSLGGTGAYTFTETIEKKPAKPTPKKPKKAGDADTPGKESETQVKTGRVSGKKDSGRNYTIQFDEATNALIVGGSPKIIDAVLFVVNKLDVPRPQVLIEAIIADISDNQVAEITSNLNQDNTIDSDRYTGLLLDLIGGTENVAKLRIGARVEFGRENSFSLLITALRNDKNTNILSTPSILTLNNEEAMIDVSDKRYVQEGRASGTGNVNINATYKPETFGTLLKVTPQITEGRAVRLDIEQKTEDLQNDPSAASGTNQVFPESTIRKLETTVVVNDGDILVLGGLIKDTRIEQESRVPLLSRIPILGRLFRDTRSSNDSQTLAIFIRPTILRTPEDSYEFSKEKYAKLRFEQLLYGESIDSLLSDEETDNEGVLPDIKSMEQERQRLSDLMQSRGDTMDEQNGDQANVAPSEKKRRIVKRIIRRRPSETL